MTAEGVVADPVLHAPRVHTPLPGPRSAALLARQDRQESNARAYPRRLPIALRRGSGCYVEDEDGNVFLDFLSGAGVLALGYGHPELVAAVHRQAEVLTHGLDFPTAVKDRFTTRLLGLLPGELGRRGRVHFCGPSGADAVDAAVKLCKKATGRDEVVAFQGGFHGMSHSAMALSSDAGPRVGIGNVMPGVRFLPFPGCHRCPFGLTPDDCATACATYLERTLTDTHSGLTRPAAVLIELVQGEGGTVVAPRSFVRRLRAITRELDIPLVVDEIQTGCGRTGRWFAFEHHDIEPDVVVLSKMVSGIGMPVALIAYHERLDAWGPGAHTGTFRGNQLAFASATEFLDIVERDDVLANVRARGEQAANHLARLRGRYPNLVADTRGLGLMLGLEFARAADAATVQRAALDRGLIVELGGRHRSVVRMLPPLNIDESTMNTALAVLDEAVASVASGTGGAA